MSPLKNGENYYSFYEDVDKLISQKRLITVFRKYIIPTPIEIKFKVTYKKFEGYSDAAAKAAIQRAIEQYLLEYGRLGSIIKHSDIIYMIESLSCIDWCFVLMKKSGSSFYSSENIVCGEREFPVKSSASFLELIRA